ncbi:MAG TPA: class F sortase [Candidatus Micrarchaeaceae archaeon]|nr:class F sortase [Candidatus Micrarchaeaceae archaeon]
MADRADAMVRTRPTTLKRVALPTALLGEIVLVALLAVTVATSWRDGFPTDQLPDLVAPITAGSTQVTGNNLSGKPDWWGSKPVVHSAPAAQPYMPSAPPVQLLIPLLDVHRAVEMVGVDQFGTLQLPVNAWNAGWYRWGPVPGAPGDAVIEGHAGYPKHPMIFGKLATLQPGAKIVVVLADGTRQLFIVASMTSVPAGTTPAGLGSFSGRARLTLVTCTGHFDKKNFWYSDRLLLQATYAGLA